MRIGHFVEPNTSKQPCLQIYKWCVAEVDDRTGSHEVIAYTVRRESAEDYAKQMNENGFIEVGD